MVIIVLPTMIIDDNKKVFPPSQINDNDAVTEDRYRQISELDFSITHNPTNRQLVRHSFILVKDFPIN